MKPVEFYSDGVRVLRWTFRPRLRWARGLALGVAWEPGPFHDCRAAFSAVVVHLGPWMLRVEHLNTFSTWHG